MNLNDKCNSIWFNQYAKTDAYKYQLRNIIQPAVNQSSFTTANYRKLKIPLPPISIQNEFADFVRQVEPKYPCSSNPCQLEQNYKSLMQKCFRRKYSDELFNIEVTAMSTNFDFSTKDPHPNPSPRCRLAERVSPISPALCATAPHGAGVCGQVGLQCGRFLVKPYEDKLVTSSAPRISKT